MEEQRWLHAVDVVLGLRYAVLHFCAILGSKLLLEQVALLGPYYLNLVDCITL